MRAFRSVALYSTQSFRTAATNIYLFLPFFPSSALVPLVSEVSPPITLIVSSYYPLIVYLTSLVTFLFNPFVLRYFKWLLSFLVPPSTRSLHFGWNSLVFSAKIWGQLSRLESLENFLPLCTPQKHSGSSIWTGFSLWNSWTHFWSYICFLKSSQQSTSFIFFSYKTCNDICNVIHFTLFTENVSYVFFKKTCYRRDSKKACRLYNLILYPYFF